MSANKSMMWYLENNDFEGAASRLENTTAAWRNRWFAVCETIYNRCKELAKRFVLDPFEKKVKVITDAIVGKRKSKYQGAIQISADCTSLLDEAKQKCYLFEFFDDQDRSICSKVGTTTKEVIERLKDELRDKTYIKMGAVRAVIHRVYDCGEIPAEGLESYFRAAYILKYPDTFKKNDRFMNAKFDLLEADKICDRYLSGKAFA